MAGNIRPAASVIRYRKTASFVAAGSTVVAFLLCAFLGMGKPEYEAQAVLSYSPDDLSPTGVSTLSAETVAARALDDAHLENLVNGLGLYPEMRQGASQAAAVARLRSQVAVTQTYMSQTSQLYVHVAFRDQDALKGPAVANALADVLATYVPPGSNDRQRFDEAGNFTPPPSPRPSSISPVAPTAPGLPVPSQAAASRPSQPLPPAGNLSALSKDQLRRKMNWVEGQLADLETEESTLHAASLTLQGRISQIQNAGRSEASAPIEQTRPVDPSAATRAQLTQELSVEQKKLAALRERYTDAYPDVQTSEANVARIQALLGRLPAVPREPAALKRAPDLYQGRVDQLTVQESQVGEKLRDIERQVSSLEHRREQIRVAIQAAPIASTPQTAAPVKSQPDQTASGPPLSGRPAVLPVAPSSPGGNQQPTSMPFTAAGDFDLAPVRPFHLVEAATSSVRMNRLSPRVFTTVGAVLAVILLLCLLPLFFMTNAIVTNEEDLQALLPPRIARLGSIPRIEH